MFEDLEKDKYFKEFYSKANLFHWGLEEFLNSVERGKMKRPERRNPYHFKESNKEAIHLYNQLCDEWETYLKKFCENELLKIYMDAKYSNKNLTDKGLMDVIAKRLKGEK